MLDDCLLIYKQDIPKREEDVRHGSSILTEK